MADNKSIKVRKKPVVVEAYRWNGEFNNDVTDFSWMVAAESQSTKCPHCGVLMVKHGWVKTLEGGHIACPGDWIITGIKGEKYPCKPDIFEQTYEKVTDEEETSGR